MSYNRFDLYAGHVNRLKLLQYDGVTLTEGKDDGPIDARLSGLPWQLVREQPEARLSAEVLTKILCCCLQFEILLLIALPLISQLVLAPCIAINLPAQLNYLHYLRYQLPDRVAKQKVTLLVACTQTVFIHTVVYCLQRDSVAQYLNPNLSPNHSCEDHRSSYYPNPEVVSKLTTHYPLLRRLRLIPP